MKTIKTALIGTGFMGRTHAEAIRRVGNVEIAAVASITAEMARDFANLYGIPRATGDYNEILADKEISAVHVLTPNALHYPMAKAALEAGKHVLCEKPLTMSVGGSAGAGGSRGSDEPGQLHQPQPALLPGGAADPPHDRSTAIWARS